MTEVFDLLFTLFENVIGFMKEIPLTENVSLFDFSIAILIMSIIVVAFVPIVQVGSTTYVNETLKAEKAQHEKDEREYNNFIKKMERDSYATYKSNRFRKELYNKRYNEEMRRK